MDPWERNAKVGKLTAKQAHWAAPDRLQNRLYAPPSPPLHPSAPSLVLTACVVARFGCRDELEKAIEEVDKRMARLVRACGRDQVRRDGADRCVL